MEVLLVPGGGLEPPRLAVADFESAASTDSAIPAQTRQAAGCKERALSRISPDPTSRPRRPNARCH